MLVNRGPPPNSPEASTIQNATLQTLIVMQTHIHASYYTMVAGFVVYLWDILLTMDDEYALLWTKGGRLVKSLYLTNRYLPLVGLLLVLYVNNPIRTGHLTDDICKGTFILVQLCQAIEIMVATSIFIIRIHTVYAGNRFAQHLMIAMLVASHLTLLVFSISICVDLAKTMFYAEQLRFCVGTPTIMTGGMYIAPIIIESFILCMTLLHALHFSRTRIGFDETVAGSILRTLYVDGSLYYLIVFSLRLGTTFVYYFASESLILLMPYLEYSLTSTVTSRWFLSFRRVLIDTFSPEPTLSMAVDRTQETGAAITFGGMSNRPRRSGRRIETFISSFASQREYDAQKDEVPFELGFSNSTDHELKTLDSSWSPQHPEG